MNTIQYNLIYYLVYLYVRKLPIHFERFGQVYHEGYYYLHITINNIHINIYTVFNGTK